MATSPNNANRLFDGGVHFLGGVNSLLAPQLLSKNDISWGVNIVNKGGIIALRPGYASRIRYPDGKAQGFTLFTPVGSRPTMVAAVSGRIYVSPYPFTSYTRLENIQFDAFVDQVMFKECLQTVNSGTLIDPKPVLIMQDGKTKAAYWDGSTNRHLQAGGATMETVIGFYMEWIGGRLWVARGNQVFASDIYDPLHFTETTYLSGGGSFQPLDGKDVTGLARTADNKSLLVFTLDNTTIIRAGITQRSTWNSVTDFVSLLFPGVGAVSGKSFSYNNGELWWFSKEGARRFTQVGSTIQVSRNNVASVEMDRSFRNLSPTLNRVCSFSFDSYVGFSVPSGDLYNRHTWVIDNSPESSLGSDAPPCWQGIWMGTRPVEWASGTINGTKRCFFLSQDRDGGVRVWEAFNADKTDDGHQIYWSAEMPALRFGEELGFKRFFYDEIHLTGVLDNVHFWAEYKGNYGCWKKILDIEICALKCRQLDCTDKNTAPTPQNRFYKTQEAAAACSSEGTLSQNIGTFFQSRFRAYGIAGIDRYRSQAIQWQESSTGSCSTGDLDAEGNVTCRELVCCDMEVDYISIPNDHHYGSGSSSDTSNSI